MHKGMRRILENLNELELEDDLLLLSDISSLLAQIVDNPQYNGRITMASLINKKKYTLIFEEVKPDAKS